VTERSEAPTPRLGIVVVNYGSSGLLRENLAAIDTGALDDPVVVVVDSRSTPAERSTVVALARRHGWRTELPDTNVGFGRGMNRGVQRATDAGCDTFLLLNPDVTIDATAIATLVRAAVADPLTVLSPRLRLPDGSTWFAGARLDRRTGLTRYRPEGPDGWDHWLTGACLLITRTCWELVGGFDDRYFLYWEDVDLSRRVLGRGGGLRVVDDVVAVHRVRGTQRVDGMSTIYVRFMCRNRLLFAAIHAPPGDRVRWLALAPRYARRILLGDGRGAALRRPSLVAAAAWGTADGAVTVVRSLVTDAVRRVTGRRRRALADGGAAGAETVVLESFGPPRARSNPYRLQLVDSMPGSVRVHYFSWTRALTGRYDVFHVHWPEVVLQGRNRLRTTVRCTLFIGILLRLRAQRKAVVRTLHDMAPYDPLTAFQRVAIRLLDRWTTLWITLTDVTPPSRPAPTAVVPHGHYRDWFAGVSRAPSRPGRLLHFGLLRRYKGIGSLLAAFAALADDHVTLRIVGYPQDRETALAVRRACGADRRVSAVTEYVPDDELVREVTESELVVLPFDRITNSGSRMLALSLDRPVLVPSTPITEELAAEVGPGWVLTYRGALAAGDLSRALREVRDAPARRPPDLTRRDWDAIGAQHAAAFARAVAISRRTGGDGG
jgi:GT2 family glycosyltransferase